MSDEKKNINAFDAISDENNTENIVLYNEKDEPMEFEQIAIIPLNDVNYVILKPVGDFMGVKEDEAIVFAFEEDEDGEEQLVIINDERADEVFEEYYKLLDEAEKE